MNNQNQNSPRKDPRIWFSSDWHLGHTNIAGPKVSQWEKGYRGFDNVHEMNKCITQTVNKYVGEDDILYFLGDFCFGGHEKTPGYRMSIRCKNIHACRGNHDKKIDLYKDYFSSIQDVLTVKHGQNTFFLSHYSHRIWYRSHKGIIHCYGHSHGNIPDYGKSMDVGIDVAYKMFGEYRPFSIEEIVGLMDKKQIAFVDHHGDKTNNK